MAAGNTYMLIESYTIPNSSTTTYTFSNIPQTYDDLELWMSARNSANNAGGYEVRLNGLGSGNTQLYLRNSNGSNIVSGYQGNTGDFVHWCLNQDTASVFTTNTVYISNYSSTTYGKVMLARNGGRYYYGAAGNSQQGLNTGNFDTTSAITSIGVGYSDAFAQNTVLTLYGIKRA